VGAFYQDKGNYLGSQSRYKEIVDQYQGFSMRDEVLFRLAQNWEKMNNKDEAAVYLTQIAQGFPFSKHFEEAKSELKAMGKPIPQVDTQLAALNQSHLKQSAPFSPLRPLIDFASALGLKPIPDRYETAKKTVAAQQAEATVQAATAKAGTAEKSASDILIQTEIKKDVSGKTQVSTVLGGNATATQTNADKNGDGKKKDDNSKKNKSDKNNKKPPSP
jgi:hypothetical protein